MTRARTIGTAFALAIACASSSPAHADVDERIACVLTGDTLAQQAALRARPDAPPFGTILGSSQRLSVRVSLPTGPGGIAVVHVDGGGLVLDGFVAGGAWIYPRKPVRVAPTLIVGGGTELTWVDGLPGRVVVESKAPEGYRPAHSLRTTVACEALSLAFGAYEERALRAATGLPDALRTSRLKPRVDIPLSAEPNGPVEGTLRLGADDAPTEFEIVAEHAGFAQVIVPRAYAVVHGWIPTRFFAAPKKHGGDEGGVLGGILGGLGLSGSGPPPAGRTCKAELPLAVRTGDRIDAVGKLQAGTLFQTRGTAGDHTLISLPKLFWLSLDKRAQLAVPTAALGRCAD